MKRPKPPSEEEIIKAHHFFIKKVNINPYSCWCCQQYKWQSKCHIIRYSLGGNNKPQNFLLLCNQCHILQEVLSDLYILNGIILSYTFLQKCIYCFNNIKPKNNHYRKHYHKKLKLLNKKYKQNTKHAKAFNNPFVLTHLKYSKKYLIPKHIQKNYNRLFHYIQVQ